MKRSHTLIIEGCLAVLFLILTINNLTEGAVTKPFRNYYLQLTRQSNKVLAANDTGANMPNFIHILPDLISAFENDNIPDADTSGAGTGGAGTVPGGTVNPGTGTYQYSQLAVPREGDGGVEIFNIINNAASIFGIPPKLLEGAMRTECGGKFGASDAEIRAWSAEGAGIPASGSQWVSHCYNDAANAGAGPAQFNGVDNFLYYANRANQISGLNRQTLNIENMVDAIYAAALKFTEDANPANKTQWTCEEVKRAAVCYQQGCGGTPSSYALQKLRTMWYFYVDGNYDAGESTGQKPTPC